MRLMHDGINSDAPSIPANAQIVAGYVDGLYKWSDTDWARFPQSVKVRIAVFATTDDGHVLDCEPGNNTPASSVDWVLMRRRAGMDPTVYCGRNTWWSEIRAAFQARGVPEPHYWVADYGVSQSNPQIPSGALALQYADVGPYDLSVVADYWPGVDQGVPVILGQDDLAAIWNYSIPRGGPNVSGGTTPGGMVSWNDQHVLDIEATVKSATSAVGAKVDALAAKAVTPSVDATALATALAADAGFLKALAHAVAVELRNDLPAA